MDSSDLSTITESSGAVSQWTDKSANGHAFTQSTGAAQPITGTRTVNGRNAIDFEGNDVLLKNSISVVSPSDGSFTIFAVALPDLSNVDGGIFGGDPQGGNRPPQFLRLTSTTLNSTRVSNFAGTFSVSVASLSSALVAGNVGLFISRLAAGSFQVFADRRRGTEVGTTGGASAALSSHQIGTIGGGVLRFNGLICEIIVYPLALTYPQMSVVENYLSAKWGTP
jgi:hypothetical protein